MICDGGGDDGILSYVVPLGATPGKRLIIRTRCTFWFDSMNSYFQRTILFPRRLATYHLQRFRYLRRKCPQNHRNSNVHRQLALLDPLAAVEERLAASPMPGSRARCYRSAVVALAAWRALGQHVLPGKLKRAISGSYHAILQGKYARLYLAEAAYRFNRRFDLRAILPRLARAMVLCKPHPEPVLRLASFFHGGGSGRIKCDNGDASYSIHLCSNHRDARFAGWNGMTTILATASVKCNDPNTQIFDEVTRRENYFNACAWWLRNPVVSRMVLCENSDDHLLGVMLEEVAAKNCKKFEYLHFNGDSRAAFMLGKGFGEGEIIKHAIQHSSLINDLEYGFYKITGRLTVANFDDIDRRIDATSNVFRLMSTRLRSALMVDTRFFYVQTKFYVDNLLNTFMNVDDRNGVFLEHVFYHELARNPEVSGMPRYPLLQGRSATTGKDYASSRWMVARDIANLLRLYDL